MIVTHAYGMFIMIHHDINFFHSVGFPIGAGEQQGLLKLRFGV